MAASAGAAWMQSKCQELLAGTSCVGAEELADCSSFGFKCHKAYGSSVSIKVTMESRIQLTFACCIPYCKLTRSVDDSVPVRASQIDVTMRMHETRAKITRCAAPQGAWLMEQGSWAAETGGV